MKTHKIILILGFVMLAVGGMVVLSSAADDEGGDRLWNIVSKYGSKNTVPASPSSEMANQQYQEEYPGNARKLYPVDRDLEDQKIETITHSHQIDIDFNEANEVDQQQRMLDEPAEEFIDSDIEDQNIKEIVNKQKIDEAYSEAKEIVVPVAASVPEVESVPAMEEPAPFQRVVQPVIKQKDESAPQTSEVESSKSDAAPTTMTAVDIISSAIKSELVETRIDLDFEDTEISDILMTLAASGQLNIVLDPILKNNRMDLHLKQVLIRDAFLLIATSYDLGFKRIGDSLYITKQDKLREQSLITKVIKLRNISVEDAKTLVEDLADAVHASAAINSLTVTGSPDKIVKIEEIIRKIDNPQPQVILEAKIIEVNKDALKDLGIDWSDQINMSAQENARSTDFDDIEDAPGNPLEIFAFSRSPIQFDSVIKMLENQNKAKVLSNPRVTTMNNQEAEIFVGDRIPYTVTTVSGGVATTDVRFEEPGIRLAITPSIIEEDFVVIKIEPEVSFIFAFRGPNSEFPHTKKRQATAYVRVENRQPFILGGLLNQEDKQNLFQVPVLGKVPLLGNLFTYEKHIVVDTELIITVIPTIVSGRK